MSDIIDQIHHGRDARYAHIVPSGCAGAFLGCRRRGVRLLDHCSSCRSEHSSLVAHIKLLGVQASGCTTRGVDVSYLLVTQFRVGTEEAQSLGNVFKTVYPFSVAEHCCCLRRQLTERNYEGNEIGPPELLPSFEKQDGSKFQDVIMALRDYDDNNFSQTMKDIQQRWVCDLFMVSLT